MTIEVQVYEGDGVEPDYMIQRRLAKEAARQRLEQDVMMALKNNLHKKLDQENVIARGWRDGVAICPLCQRIKPSGDILHRHRMTFYEDEKSNWIKSCQDCYDYDMTLMKAQWDEYYQGTGVV